MSAGLSSISASRASAAPWCSMTLWLYDPWQIRTVTWHFRGFWMILVHNWCHYASVMSLTFQHHKFTSFYIFGGYKNTKNYNYIYIVYTCLYHIDLHEDILIKTLLPLAQAATVAAPGRHQRRRGLRSHPLCKLICGWIWGKKNWQNNGWSWMITDDQGPWTGTIQYTIVI